MKPIKRKLEDGGNGTRPIKRSREDGGDGMRPSKRPREDDPNPTDPGTRPVKVKREDGAHEFQNAPGIGPIKAEPEACKMDERFAIECSSFNHMFEVIVRVGASVYDLRCLMAGIVKVKKDRLRIRTYETSVDMHNSERLEAYGITPTQKYRVKFIIVTKDRTRGRKSFKKKGRGGVLVVPRGTQITITGGASLYD